MKLMQMAIGVCLMVGLNGVTVSYAQEREVPNVPMIPGGQKACTFSANSTSSGVFSAVPGSLVTINNGLAARNVIVQFSSEAVISAAGQRLNVRLSIDGGPAQIFGPEFFAGDTIFSTRTAIWTVPMAAGVHTAQVMFNVTGGTGTLWFRCLTAEGRTK